MIISRTPYRLSLVGGSTDFPSWFLKHGGIVVGGSIDKFSYLTTRFLPPFHEFKSRLMYSSIETVKDNKDIEHRAVKAVIDYLDMQEKGLEICHLGDLPGKSGTGSSSTFVVGLLNSLSALKGSRRLPHELASEAIHIEQVLLGETVGCQDQTFAAHGGLNVIRFKTNGEISVYPVVLNANKLKELEASLMLFFTGVNRISSHVAQTYAHALAGKQREQWAMMRLAEEAVDAIHYLNVPRLGWLMDQSWRIKRGLSDQVSTPEIDETYARVRVAGAFGGKLIGAGGGGCLLLVVPPEKRQIIKEAAGLLEIPFRFDFDGSQIVFVGKENLND